MKDYDHVILWIDYFNKNLNRRKGRKVRRDEAVFDPTIEDLIEASKSAGFDVQEDQINSGARFPRRSFVRSGYVMLAKKEGVKKSKMLSLVAARMHQRHSKLQRSSRK